MIQNLIKGQKVELGKISEFFDVFIKINDKVSLAIDLMLWVMDEKNQVNKNNIVFYNQPYSMCISYDEYERKMKIHMDQVDEKIKKIVCVATIYEELDENKELDFSLEIQRDEKIFCIDANIDSKEYKSIIIGEIYRYKDSWKLSTIFYESPKDVVSCMKQIYDVSILR